MELALDRLRGGVDLDPARLAGLRLRDRHLEHAVLEAGGHGLGVDTLRQRPRGYGWSGGRLSRVTTSHPVTDIVPVQAEIGASSLLRASAPPIGVDVWPPLHSAWLCPQIPFSFDLGLVPSLDGASPTPQPV